MQASDRKEEEKKTDLREKKNAEKEKKLIFFSLSLSHTHTHTKTEYVCQAGVWSALGGPDAAKRDRFYKYANWMYQAGGESFFKSFFSSLFVSFFLFSPSPFQKKKKKKPTQVFVSRTFGGLLRLSRAQLWLLPSFQVLLLALFVAAGASSRRWMELSPALLPFPLLLAPALAVGLLGGLGYVSTFTLLADCVPFPPLRQVSLAAVSVADSAGIALADAASVLVQGCLFRAAGIPGAAFKCGWRGGGEGGR